MPLPGRGLLSDRISVGINTASRGNNNLVILFLNLNGFKKINDSLGCGIGVAGGGRRGGN